MSTLDFRETLNRRAPGFPIEMRAQGAPLGDDVHHVLILAEKNGTSPVAGTGTVNVPTQAIGERALDVLAGPGSRAATIYNALGRMVQGVRVTAILLDEPGAGVKTTKTVTITGTVTADHERVFHIGGTLVKIAVEVGDTVTDIAAALVAAIAANTDLPMVAANASGVATLTDKVKGINGLGIVVGHGDPRTGDDEALVLVQGGITSTIAAGVSGTSQPDLTAAIAALGEVRYDTILTSLSDATSVAALEAELGDRFHAESMLQGLAFCAVRGTDGTMTSLGLARNSEHSVLFGAAESVTLPWECAALFAGADAAARLPNIPRRNVILDGMVAPPKSKRSTRLERELLLRSGISTFYVDTAGRCRVDLGITTYQETPLGVADDRLLFVTTMRSLSAYRQRWFAEVTIAGDGKVIVDDGQIVDADVPAITLEAMKTVSIDFFRRQMRRGLVRNESAFIASLDAQLNSLNDSRIDVGHFPKLVKELTQVATFVGFS